MNTFWLTFDDYDDQLTRLQDLEVPLGTPVPRVGDLVTLPDQPTRIVKFVTFDFSDAGPFVNLQLSERE